MEGKIVPVRLLTPWFSTVEIREILSGGTSEENVRCSSGSTSVQVNTTRVYGWRSLHCADELSTMRLEKNRPRHIL